MVLLLAFAILNLFVLGETFCFRMGDTPCCCHVTLPGVSSQLHMVREKNVCASPQFLVFISVPLGCGCVYCLKWFRGDISWGLFICIF